MHHVRSNRLPDDVRSIVMFFGESTNRERWIDVFQRSGVRVIVAERAADVAELVRAERADAVLLREPPSMLGLAEELRRQFPPMRNIAVTSGHAAVKILLEPTSPERVLARMSREQTLADVKEERFNEMLIEAGGVKKNAAKRAGISERQAHRMTSIDRNGDEPDKPKKGPRT